MTNTDELQPSYTAFAGYRKIAGGDLRSVLTDMKQYSVSNGSLLVIFDDSTGKQVDFDLTGELADVLARHAPPSKAGPGRPRLGVVGREISLLPRHWDWLEEQPNGASAAIRRLVEEARKREPDSQRERRMRDATARFMWTMAGDLPNFEEATRALYADDTGRLAELMSSWPSDVRQHVLDRVHHTATARATATG